MDRKEEVYEFIHDPGYARMQGHAVHWGSEAPGSEADSRYVIRADLPGLNPDEDIRVTVEGDALTIYAERREEQQGSNWSEHRQCSFSRTVALQGEPDPKDIDARYHNGVLEVRVPGTKPDMAVQQISVQHD